MSGHYDSLEDYTAGVEASVKAYRQDRLAEAGVCQRCERRKKEKGRRICWGCRKEGRK